MSRRRPHIPPRRRIFVGCEGACEVGYVALLQRLADEKRGVHVHIHPEPLQPGAGDPIALIRRAQQRIAALERNRTRFALKAVLIDLSAVAAANEAAQRLSAHTGIHHLIWQDPDHEALLLRHLPECHTRRPPRGESLDQLQREWREYSKPMTAAQLATKLALEHVHRASTVEPALRRFLEEIGLL